MKRPEDRDAAYAGDIVKFASELRGYMHGVHRGEFDRNTMMQRAVERLLGKIGEAASCLSPKFKANHPGVPWKNIVGLRQILIHVYWKINPNIIWSTARRDIRVLLAYLRKMQKKPALLEAEIQETLSKGRRVQGKPRTK